MKSETIATVALKEYIELMRIRNNRTALLVIKLGIVLFLMCLFLYEDRYGIENFTIELNGGDKGYAYILFGGLVFCLLIRLMLLYLDKIPGLWLVQERMEKKEFERLKKTYQYQVRLKYND